MKKFILIVIALVILNDLVLTKRDFIPSPEQTSFFNEKKVIFYSTKWCGYCTKTRKFLRANNIDYHEYDIEKSKEGLKQYNRLGVSSVPILLINGRVVKGYQPKLILSLSSSM